MPRYSVNPKTAPRPCTAHDLTWGPMGAQCLNCGSESGNSYDLRHSPQLRKEAPVEFLSPGGYRPPEHRHEVYFNAVRDPNNPNDR